MWEESEGSLKVKLESKFLSWLVCPHMFEDINYIYSRFLYVKDLYKTYYVYINVNGHDSMILRRV